MFRGLGFKVWGFVLRLSVFGNFWSGCSAQGRVTIQPHQFSGCSGFGVFLRVGIVGLA